MAIKRKISEVGANYDVIVAGGGLAGLTAANVLGKSGKKVLLAEQHFKLGGLATVFRRKHHIFDVSLHGFPVGMIKTFRRYWSREIADQVIQVKRICFDNPQFSLETDFTESDFTRILIEKFGQPEEKVRGFYKELEEMNYYDRNDETNGQLFERYFPGRNDVVRLLMEPITYANGSTLDEPAITYGIVFSNFMSKGVYTFAGGTDAMLDMMEAQLLENNVDIVTSAKVEKIGVERDRVKSALVGGRSIACNSFISNGNLLSTICDWVGEDYFSRNFIDKVHEVRINNSSCQVYLGIKPGQHIDNIGDLLFTSEYPVFEPSKIVSPDVTSRTFSIYYPELRPETPDYTIVASMNADYRNWAGMPDEEYRKAKQKMVAGTITALEKYLPGVSEKLDWVEAATPRTFQRYTLHRGGASFGTKFEGLEVSMELPKQIGGLFHSGSVGIIMSGWLGAANYGVITARNVEKFLLDNNL